MVIPNDYSQKLEIAKDLDGELHRRLRAINDTPHGPLYLMQLAIGRAGHDILPSTLTFRVKLCRRCGGETASRSCA